MIEFKWYQQKRLNEQLKFFGAKKKGFISCYAKQVKPRIRVKVEKYARGYEIEADSRLALMQAAATQSSNDYLRGLANQQQAFLGMQNIGIGQASQVAGMRGDIGSSLQPLAYRL